jgi:hypothetical protein
MHNSRIACALTLHGHSESQIRHRSDEFSDQDRTRSFRQRQVSVEVGTMELFDEQNAEAGANISLLIQPAGLR